MLSANVLGVIILIIEVSRNIGDHLGEKYKKRRKKREIDEIACLDSLTFFWKYKEFDLQFGEF